MSGGEKRKMDASRIIIGAVSIAIGLIMLPLVATFVLNAKANNSTKAIGGLTSILDIIVYGFAFGLVGIGVGMIYLGSKK